MSPQQRWNNKNRAKMRVDQRRYAHKMRKMAKEFMKEHKNK